MIEEVQILTQKVYGKRAFNTSRFPARYAVFPEMAIPFAKMEACISPLTSISVHPARISPPGPHQRYFLTKAFLRISEVSDQLRIRDRIKVIMNFTTAGRL